MPRRRNNGYPDSRNEQRKPFRETAGIAFRKGGSFVPFTLCNRSARQSYRASADREKRTKICPDENFDLQIKRFRCKLSETQILGYIF